MAMITSAGTTTPMIAPKMPGLPLLLLKSLLTAKREAGPRANWTQIETEVKWIIRRTNYVP